MNPTPNRGLKAWGSYVGGSAILLGLAGALAAPWLSAPARPGVWVGLAVAFTVQAIAFAIFLFAARRRSGILVAGRAAGAFLRLISVGVLGLLFVSDAGPLIAESTLLAMTGGLLLLLWLEPVAYCRSELP